MAPSGRIPRLSTARSLLGTVLLSHSVILAASVAGASLTPDRASFGVPDALCDDGDPCTADAGPPSAGCTHTPVTGLESIACTFARGLPVCLGEPTPAKIERRFAKAWTRTARAGTSATPRQQAFHLKKAARHIRKAARANSRAGDRGILPGECTASLGAALELVSASIQRFLPATRPFYMGFTGFPHDDTAAALLETREFVRANADIVAHHIEGTPWAEALYDLPFSATLQADWSSKTLSSPEGGRTYLALSPGRDRPESHGLALPLPAELEGKPFDDPRIMSAFLNYCRRAVEYFQPDYLAIGIEVNEKYTAAPSIWAAYARLHIKTYQALKRDYPELPIFASFSLHNLFHGGAGMLRAFLDLMPYNDVVAISFYPFLAGAPPADVLAWAGTQFDRFEKPYAIAETNDSGDIVVFPVSGFVIDGNPTKQQAYYDTLLSFAHRRHFEFLISFIHRDYDPLWEKIKYEAPEAFIAWRDCGLIDEDGLPRPAYAIWKQYLQRARSR